MRLKETMGLVLKVVTNSPHLAPSLAIMKGMEMKKERIMVIANCNKGNRHFKSNNRVFSIIAIENGNHHIPHTHTSVVAHCNSGNRQVSNGNRGISHNTAHTHFAYEYIANRDSGYRHREWKLPHITTHIVRRVYMPPPRCSRILAHMCAFHISLRRTPNSPEYPTLSLSHVYILEYMAPPTHTHMLAPRWRTSIYGALTSHIPYTRITINK